MLGPLLWNIYIKDLLNLVPSDRTYADNITVSMAFTPGEEASMTSRLNATLRLTEGRGTDGRSDFPRRTHSCLWCPG